MRKTILLVMAALGVITVRVDADGMLDPSFGNGGLVTTGFPGFSVDSALALVVLPDGRAVAAGFTNPNLATYQMAAARYLTTGALDTTFDGDGLVAVGFFLPPPVIDVLSEARSVVLQPDGRVVLVGYVSAGPPPQFFFALARLNANGSLDTAFGTAGTVMTPMPGGGGATAALLQPDGRIVAVGQSGTSIGAARYNADGSLDPTFGSGGTLVVPLPGSFEIQHAVLQPDGKLVIAGSTPSSQFANRDFALVRLLPSGALDMSFSGDGLATVDFGAIETGDSVILLGDGRLVLAGSRGTAPPNAVTDFALTRFLPDGALDTSFGTAGLALADSGDQEYGAQLLRLFNGNLLVAGSTTNGADFLLSRLLPNGTLDPSFGTGGFLRTDFAGFEDQCSAVAIAAPDRILAAGATRASAGFPNDFALARYIATTPVELLSFEVQ